MQSCCGACDRVVRHLSRLAAVTLLFALGTRGARRGAGGSAISSRSDFCGDPLSCVATRCHGDAGAEVLAVIASISLILTSGGLQKSYAKDKPRFVAYRHD